MTATVLMGLAAAIPLLFGCLHLLFTFVGRRLLPRDPTLQQHMQAGPIRITNETTVWRCWIGFNASHSMALMLFGLVYGFLALSEPALLFHSMFLQGLGLATLLGFAVLARLYWFSLPLAGMSVASALYIGSLVAAYG